MKANPSPEAPRGLPIGKAAAWLGTTPKALRTYHARGLVDEPPRDESGYRRYDPETLVRLARVRRLRELGFSLEAIEPLLVADDGGASLRDALRRLDCDLADEARALRRRRSLIKGWLRERVHDPLVVSQADVWEESGVAWLRQILPDLTAAEELSERRFQRLLQTLAPPIGSPPPLPDPDKLDPDVRRRLGETRRRFHALEAAAADDSSVEALVPEMADALSAAMMTSEKPAGTDVEQSHEDAEVAMSAFSAMLVALPEAQRRVVEGVMTAMLAAGTGNRSAT